MKDLLHDQPTQFKGPVECFGLSFPNEKARREHFLRILSEKLKDPAFRKIEGFPIGSEHSGGWRRSPG